MPETVRTGPERGAHHGGASHGVDWEAAEHSPEFQELVTRRRRFVYPATIFFLLWYLGFILLAGYAPDFMGSTFLVEGLTVGYVLALTQFIMTWVLAGWYVRKSGREFDPLARKAAETALEAGRASARGGRSNPGDTTTGSGEVTPR